MLAQMMSPLAALKPSRRGFLLGSAAVSGGLMIGFQPSAASAQAARVATNPFKGYVKIGADNTVTIYSAHFDMGQRIYAGIATLVNEELRADWSQMSVGR